MLAFALRGVPQWDGSIECHQSDRTGGTVASGVSVIACRGCGRAQAKALCDACRASRYRGQHDARRVWAPIVALGQVRCARADSDPECPGLIGPGDDWDLDHVDGTRHPAHAPCNRRAGALSL